MIQTGIHTPHKGIGILFIKPGACINLSIRREHKGTISCTAVAPFFCIAQICNQVDFFIWYAIFPEMDQAVFDLPQLLQIGSFIKVGIQIQNIDIDSVRCFKKEPLHLLQGLPGCPALCYRCSCPGDADTSRLSHGQTQTGHLFANVAFFHRRTGMICCR